MRGYSKLSSCCVCICNSKGGVKFGIHFTSCRENGSEITRGAAECNFTILATTSGIYPKISLLLVLSQINTKFLLLKSKYYLQTRFHAE